MTQTGRAAYPLIIKASLVAANFHLKAVIKMVQSDITGMK